MAIQLTEKDQKRVKAALKKVHEIFGTHRKIAEALEMNNSQNVSQWFVMERLVPPLRALQIQKATQRKVKAKDLRLDIDFKKY